MINIKGANTLTNPLKN